MTKHSSVTYFKHSFSFFPNLNQKKDEFILRICCQHSQRFKIRYQNFQWKHGKVAYSHLTWPQSRNRSTWLVLTPVIGVMYAEWLNKLFNCLHFSEAVVKLEWRAHLDLGRLRRPHPPRPRSKAKVSLSLTDSSKNMLNKFLNDNKIKINLVCTIYPGRPNRPTTALVQS